MGVSRRTFTKEFKEEAVRRLELGASVAEVARATGVGHNGSTANGEQCLNRLSQPRGQPHLPPEHLNNPCLSASHHCDVLSLKETSGRRSIERAARQLAMPAV